MSQSIISKGIAKFSEGMLDEAETLFCSAIKLSPPTPRPGFYVVKPAARRGT